MSDSLAALRQQIDAIDADMLRLFERRMAVSRAVGDFKKQSQRPILDAVREQTVLDNRVAQLADHTLAEPARSFFSHLMCLSREEQQRVMDAPAEEKRPFATPERIAYQGLPGAFGHQAALRCRGDGEAVKPYETFERVIQAVLAGEAARGVLPLENSSAGSVAEVCDLLAQYDCHIVGEVYVPVAHCLLALPGTNEADIRDIYSHEQGLLQCRDFLTRHPHWQQHPHINTAVSAQYVADTGDPSKAAIASRLAGEYYGLQILQENVQTAAHNATRFVIIADRPNPPETADKATLVFALRNERGTLHRALAAFVALGWNMTRIQSRPIPEKPWAYRFYVDTEGTGAFSRQKLAVLADALAADCSEYRVLGCYPAAEGQP